MKAGRGNPQGRFVDFRSAFCGFSGYAASPNGCIVMVYSLKTDRPAAIKRVHHSCITQHRKRLV